MSLDIITCQFSHELPNSLDLLQKMAYLHDLDHDLVHIYYVATRQIGEISQNAKADVRPTPAFCSNSGKPPSIALLKTRIFPETPPRISQRPWIFAKSPSRISHHPRIFAKTPSRISRRPRIVAKTPFRISRAPWIFAKTPSQISRAPWIFAKTPSRISQPPWIFAKTPSRISQRPRISGNLVWIVSRAAFRPHVREENYVADGVFVGQKHDQTVDPDANSSRGRHSVA